jgi:hypothetical protein
LDELAKSNARKKLASVFGPEVTLEKLGWIGWSEVDPDSGEQGLLVYSLVKNYRALAQIDLEFPTSTPFSSEARQSLLDRNSKIMEKLRSLAKKTGLHIPNGEEQNGEDVLEGEEKAHSASEATP